jgi:hypothetical protein
MSKRVNEVSLPLFLIFIAVIVIFREQIIVFFKSLSFQNVKFINSEQIEKAVIIDNTKPIENRIEETKSFFTIKEILNEYNISRQTFFNYRKIVELKDMGRVGMYVRYNIKDVSDFFEKITLEKKEHPELFKMKEIKSKSPAS